MTIPRYGDHVRGSYLNGKEIPHAHSQHSGNRKEHSFPDRFFSGI
jgi:hypothetical protein